MRSLRARLSRSSYSDSARIAQILTAEGVVVGPGHEFLSEEGKEALSRASQLVLNRIQYGEAAAALTKRKSDHKKEFLVTLVTPDQGHSSDSPLLRLALDNKLLEIVSLYFRLWPRLHSVAAWLNMPTDSEPRASQLWHRDPEDLKLIKVFIYLNAVDEDCGPFSYIPRTHPFGAASAKLRQNSKRVSDEEISLAFPPETWRICTGPTNTMILADTVGFHRGGKPKKGNRILITFTYTSGAPRSRPLRLIGKPKGRITALQRYAL
jgi:hypothetical protein